MVKGTYPYLQFYRRSSETIIATRIVVRGKVFSTENRVVHTSKYFILMICRQILASIKRVRMRMTQVLSPR